MKYWSLLFILLFSSCVIERQRQVWFGTTQRTALVANDKVTRIYLDKYGEIYPKAEVYIPYREFFRGKYKDNEYRETNSTGSLEYYFNSNKVSPLVSPINDLRKVYNIKNTPDVLVYKEASELIFKENVSKIKRDLESSKNKTLIVLVHGFNDPNPTGDYQLLRNEITKRDSLRSKDYVYLELYWDGLTANQGKPQFSKIWKRAQGGSMSAAATLRRILNEMDNCKIRLISHSLGASVITGALFNTTSKFKGNTVNSAAYNAVLDIDCTKNKDIRFGMLAPAIPGESTFVDFNKRGGNDITTLPTDNTISKIIVGHNCNDYAVSKRFFYSIDALSKKKGSTSLGANRKGEVEKAKNKLKTLDYNDETKLDSMFKSIDFSIYCYKYCNEEHALFAYLKNKTKLDIFLSELLEE